MATMTGTGLVSSARSSQIGRRKNLSKTLDSNVKLCYTYS